VSLPRKWSDVKRNSNFANYASSHVSDISVCACCAADIKSRMVHFSHRILCCSNVNGIRFDCTFLKTFWKNHPFNSLSGAYLSQVMSLISTYFYSYIWRPCCIFCLKQSSPTLVLPLFILFLFRLSPSLVKLLLLSTFTMADRRKRPFN
jgi:hypothetical protein